MYALSPAGSSGAVRQLFPSSPENRTRTSWIVPPGGPSLVGARLSRTGTNPTVLSGLRLYASTRGWNDADQAGSSTVSFGSVADERNVHLAVCLVDVVA